MKYPERSHDLTSLCMHYVVLLRSIAFWGHVLVIWILTDLLDQSFPYKPILILSIVLGVFTLVSWTWARKRTVINDKFVFLQLLVDIVALSILLYFTGGSMNPFVSLFLLPVVFAAAMLRSSYTWITAATATTAYSLLMFFYQALPLWQHHGSGFTLHVWGMWAAFLLSASLVAYFVARIGSTLKDRDQQLVKAREQMLEAEKIVALGSLAAGTAHELGTPLATIAILAKELEKAMELDDPKLAKKLCCLRGQVDRCKTILSRMAASAGQAQADTGEPIRIDQYLDETLQEWLKTRPYVALETQFDHQQPSPKILADHTISQAILNLLNNAADASSEQITVEAQSDRDWLYFKVHDQGIGLPNKLSDKLGIEPFLSTKSPEKGLGLGLYLAKTTLTRLGGDLRLYNRTDQSGVTAELSLPLNPLKTDG